jgi:hypothetical protein
MRLLTMTGWVCQSRKSVATLFFSGQTIYVFCACRGDRLRCKLLGIVSAGPLTAKSSQCACNQARIASETVGLELQRSLVWVSHLDFSASSDFQPSSENSITDPSRCFQLNEVGLYKGKVFAVCHLKDHGYITPEETNVLLNLTSSGKWDTSVNDGRP